MNAILSFVVVVVGLMATGCRSWPNPKTPAFTLDCVTNSCRTAQATITLDGRLDEPAWAAAVPITRFYEFRSDAPALLPDDQVQVRFLHDREWLYVGARIHDRDIVCNPARMTPTRGSMFLDGDTFEVFIQPDRHQTVYYEFHVNPCNSTWDCRFSARAGFMAWTNNAASWNSGMKSAAQYRGTINRADEDEGYSVEIAIPLSAFTDREGKVFVSDPGITWRYSACLYDYSRYYDDGDNAGTLNLISSSKMPQADYHMRGYFNYIRFE